MVCLDFGLTPEQEKLKNIAKEFAEKELAPKARELDKNPVFPRDLLKKICELGIGVGAIIPKEYGGNAIGHLARILVNIEIAKASAFMGLALQTIPIGLWVLLHFGNEEQKKKYIPEVAKGEKIACLAATEPTGGSDIANVNTVAKKVGNNYVVNGSKVFITLAPESDVCLFTAKTESGVSLFVVEKGTEGLTLGPADEREGLRAAKVGGIRFKDCKIPEENLVGKEGQGLRAALKGITEVGRPGNIAMAVGISEAVLERTLQFLKDRKLYGGKALAGLQGIQFTLADMYMEIEASKLLAYKVGWLLDQGKTGVEIGKEIAATKAYTSEVAKKVAFKAISLCGAYGTLPGFDLIRYLRDALETDASAGANNVCKMLLGKELTGIFSLGG